MLNDTMRNKSIRALLFSIIGLFIFVLYFYYQNVVQLNYFQERNKELISNLNSKDSNEIYTIVIDAGSTGSRIHVFRIYHDETIESGKKFDAKLLDEVLFVKVKPGLSSYSKSPDEATDSIKPLLDKALQVIPKTKHALTRLTLKATAGLRLISDELADRILANIRNLFKLYPFKVKNEDTGILDGKFEGIYSWITLNYALNSFDFTNESKVCTLDLGGGSTQITFIPIEQTIGRENFVNFKVDEADYNIYSKSFLGFGLMSARLNIFKNDVLNYLKPNNDKNQLFSSCLPKKHNSKWLQQGIEFQVNGPDSDNQNKFDLCHKTVLNSVQNKLNAPVEVRYKEIYAFSFFFDILKNSGLIKNEEGGSFQVLDIKNTTIDVCSNLNSKSFDKSTDPFLCMDLTYIFVLLSEGYGLPEDKIINVHNKVNSMEISWALGAAFHMLKN